MHCLTTPPQFLRNINDFHICIEHCKIYALYSRNRKHKNYTTETMTLQTKKHQKLVEQPSNRTTAKPFAFRFGYRALHHLLIGNLRKRLANHLFKIIKGLCKKRTKIKRTLFLGSSRQCHVNNVTSVQIVVQIIFRQSLLHN